MIVREIQTRTVPVTAKDKDGNDAPVLKDGRPVTHVVPELDANGREVELWSIEIPRAIEAKGGRAIDAYVAAARAKAATPTETPAKRGGKEPVR